MGIKNKLLYQLMLLLLTTSSMAVQLNQRGVGEVLIYPYYTVNNNLNTLYSVVNTTADTKAVAVRFLEGDNGLEVLSFNVYLSAFDVWTGALVPTFSTVASHVDEPSVLHVTSDTSCAPSMSSVQEFLPFRIDTDLDVDNHNLERARAGHIEIIEMATFIGGTVPAADHGVTGRPPGCIAIESDWSDDGIYDTLADEQPPTGGLMGSANLVNVAEGIAFSYDAIALQNFWQGSGMHTEPGSLEPNLASAFPESKVLLDSGELVTSQWDQGFQAVSAVLTKSQVINEYAYDESVAGKTEWVLTFPTKRFHSNDADEGLLAPFNELWNGLQSCDAIEMIIWDREQQESRVPFSCEFAICGTSPPIPQPELCYTSNVMEFDVSGIAQNVTSSILGSENLLNNFSIVQVQPNDVQRTENGWAAVKFLQEEQILTSQSGVAYKGLPVTGFAVQQFTNAGAQEGLLAQYGGLFKHKGLVVVEEEPVN